MYFSEQEVELLRLVGWCKNLGANSGLRFQSEVLSTERIARLQVLGLVSGDKLGRSVRLTPLGYRFLASIGIDLPQDSRSRSEPSVICRRLMNADALLTFYRAGAHVYTDGVAALSEPYTYLPAFSMRRGSNNLLNSTVFLGVYRDADTTYIVFNVTDGRGVIYLNNELKGFLALCEQSQTAKHAVIFMGNGTVGIARVTLHENAEANKVKGAVSFAKAYTEITWHVHFIPCNDSGAWVLRLMQLPNYREAIAKAALGSSYRAPYPDAPDTDAIHYAAPHMPAVIAIDMDVKRIDRAVESARAKGFAGIALYVLAEQQAFAVERYGRKGCEVFVLPVDSLQERLAGNPSLYEPPLEPYCHEGRYAYF